MREKWFGSYKCPTGISILDKKYKHAGSVYKISFYLFNDQLNYSLAHYFAESKITKGNINKLFTDPLMIPFIKKLSYKNANEWIEKPSKISWDIPNIK